MTASSARRTFALFSTLEASLNSSNCPEAGPRGYVPFTGTACAGTQSTRQERALQRAMGQPTPAGPSVRAPKPTCFGPWRRTSNASNPSSRLWLTNIQKSEGHHLRIRLLKVLNTRNSCGNLSLKNKRRSLTRPISSPLNIPTPAILGVCLQTQFASSVLASLASSVGFSTRAARSCTQHKGKLINIQIH